MKSTFVASALLVGICYTTLAAGVALPIQPTEKATPGSFTLNLHRRSDRDHAILRRSGGHAIVGASSRGIRGDWYTNATIGGQPVELMIDTGSSTLWTLSPGAQGITANASTYDPTKSQTAQRKDGDSFDVTYIGGQRAQGLVYNDFFCIGNEDACVENMPLGAASNVTAVSDFHSGVLGLAFEAANTVKPEKQPTFMDILQPALEEPIFSIKLNSTFAGGQLSFGDVDQNSYQAPLQQVSVQTNDSVLPGQWLYPNASWFQDGNDTSLGSSSLVFDTGNPLTWAPEAVVQNYFAHISRAREPTAMGQMWMVDCEETLPDLQLQLGSALMTIPGEKLRFASAGTTKCYVSLVSSGTSGIGFVGDAFFEEYVVIFNTQNKTVSWGKQT